MHRCFHLIRTHMRLRQAGAASICATPSSCPCACILSSRQNLAVLCTIIFVSVSYVLTLQEALYGRVLTASAHVLPIPSPLLTAAYCACVCRSSCNTHKVRVRALALHKWNCPCCTSWAMSPAGTTSSVPGVQHSILTPSQAFLLQVLGHFQAHTLGFFE